MEDDDADAWPTDDELRTCAQVLRRLSPWQLSDASPAMSEVVEAGMALFSKRALDERFGQRDVIEYLEQVHDHKAMLKKLEKLEAEITKTHNKYVKQAAKCGINSEREERTINNSAGGDRKEYGHILASEWRASMFVPRWAANGPGNGRQGRDGVAVPPKGFRGIFREYDSSDDGEEPDGVAEGGTEGADKGACQLLASEAAKTDTRAVGKEAARIAPGDFRRKCLVCKGNFSEVHHFYHQLCVGCGDYNYDKRSQTADLSGYVCVVTGGRIRIGYMIVLKLLRAGAHVIATTRYPHDAAQRYAKEPDFEDWRLRLELLGLELADLRSVEGFCQHVAQRFSRIHILINNAAQTLTRRDGWHHRMEALEETCAQSITPAARALLGPATPTPMLVSPPDHASNCPSSEKETPLPRPSERPCCQNPSTEVLEGIGTESAAAGDSIGACPRGVPDEGPEITTLVAKDQGASDSHVIAEWELADFPAGKFDDSAQPLDLSRENSWSRRLGDVPTVELLRTLAANAAAPFVLCGKLRPLLIPDKADKDAPWGHIVNVSALEGQFTVGRKPSGHPHTNMAKAALNMLTLTCAADLFKERVLVNAVDTGWVSDMAPGAKGYMRATHKTFIGPPLDEDDGASRVLDPVFMHVRNGFKEQGLFWKHYRVSSW
mmetsp:Transcript_29442/g.80519  ORF Transcript_29442/g.80519 Transcript_29442/m.80519 type:complete len:662 (+) Transcript_29442:57-2042(+)